VTSGMLPNVALVGKSGAGKTTVALYLVDHYGYQRASVGQIVRQITRLLYQGEAKRELNRVTDALMTIDETLLMHAALSAMESTAPVVFDSVRYASEYRHLCAASFVIWRVEASLSVRLERLRSRGQAYHPDEDEAHLSETELDSAPQQSVIFNDRTDPIHLHRQVDEIMRGFEKRLPSDGIQDAGLWT